MMEINKKNIRMLSLLGHRGTFAFSMSELAEQKKDICVMTADLCDLTGLEKFSIKYPDYFINVGIAEQNMIGIAAGLSRYGTTVFATTYANFLTMRAYEQIRMNLGLMQHNVKLIGTGAGLSMGLSGNSHFGLEDVALMRAVPNMKVICPADCLEEYKVLQLAQKERGPMYIRMSGALGQPVVYTTDYDYKIGKAVVLREGTDVVIISTGTVTYECIKAAEILEQQGISVCVVNMHTIKPIDRELILEKVRENNLIVTVEEQSVIGGLGSAVEEVLSDSNSRVRMIHLGLPDKFGISGDYDYLKKYYRLEGEFIADDILKRMTKCNKML